MDKEIKSEDNKEESINNSQSEQNLDDQPDLNENNHVNDSQPTDIVSEIKSLKDQLLRAMAETENVRKRSEKQIEDASKYAVTSFARDLINVMENLYRATESIAKENVQDNPALKSISEGVDMTKRELISVFERHGIKRISPQHGETFDPNLHQAMVQIADNNFPVGSIVQVLQAGYILKDRLLRPAMVGVAKENTEQAN